MSRKKGIYLMLSLAFVGIILLMVMKNVQFVADEKEREAQRGVYEPLLADTSKEDPLKYIAEDFTVKEGFTTNLPIVILAIDGELSEYKSFKNSQEIVDESVEPYTDGFISVIDSKKGTNTLADKPVYTSHMRIKKRGHTSMSYDKSQYLMKMVDENGLENNNEILGMGEGHNWILNGSMADKSMIRNYLAYRIASEACGGMMAPDSRFCEVIFYKDGVYEYQGVYLLMETVSRGQNRVNIDQFKQKNIYTSYIVRRDRFTNFDVMLNTYGRTSGLSKEWIGVKYPSDERLTKEAKTFIEKDFSSIERVIYAKDEAVFKVYDKYINIDTFVDYFLINEFFGNYDAGEHSTYMYKNSGGLLNIGPVWDFDQAMNNYFAEEMDPSTLAFQTKPFFEQLSKDARFIDALKARYSVLRKDVLSEEHVFSVIDEAVAYLKSAREREWYRWAADYQDGSFANAHNYYLQDYVKDGVTISRFNAAYEQELYLIRTYLHKHGNSIQTELTKLYDLAEYNTSIKSENELFLFLILVLFLVPSVIVNKKD